MTSREFCDRVRGTLVPPGALHLWWLGQHSWLLKTASRTVALDPYLSPSPHRLVPPVFAPEDADFLDLVLCSHDHSDHLDRPVLPKLAAASPRAVFILPAAVAAAPAPAPTPAERTVFLSGRDAYRRPGLSVTSLPAAHELLEVHPQLGSPALGFILETDGLTVYHSGDTCIYEGLQTRLREQPLDLALVPINGRDAVRLRRHCIGNMTYQEAVDLVGLVRPHLACPAHFGMFAGNTCDPQLFADYLEVKFPGQGYWIPTIGPGRLYRRDEAPGRPAAGASPT